MSLALKNTGGKLTTFDIDPKKVKLARENFKEAGVETIVTVVEGDAHQKIKDLKGPIDMVFIDAEKEGYADYLKQLLPLVRPGGVILAHNTAGQRRQMQDFIDVITTNPDLVTVFAEDGAVNLRASTSGIWQAPGVEVRTTPETHGVRVVLSAPKLGVSRLRLRWRGDLSSVRLFLGDHWERSYGDLEWRGEVPNRTMPWYVMTWDGTRTSGYGVATGPRAFCFWNADHSGLTLWADVRNGG
jgi:hypothetical protein